MRRNSDDDDSSDDGSDTTEAESSGEDDEYVQALADSMVEGQDDIALDDETATCVATAIVDVVGVDTLTDADISPEELAGADSFSDLDVEVADDAAAQLGGDLGECDVAEPIRPTLVEGFVSGAGTELPPEALACLEENIDNQAVADALAAVFLDGSDEGFQTAISDAVLACPEVPTAIILAQSPSGTTPEAEACVSAYVEANPDLSRAAFVDNDTAAQEQLGTQLAGACPEAFAG